MLFRSSSFRAHVNTHLVRSGGAAWRRALVARPDDVSAAVAAHPRSHSPQPSDAGPFGAAPRSSGVTAAASQRRMVNEDPPSSFPERPHRLPRRWGRFLERRCASRAAKLRDGEPVALGPPRGPVGAKRRSVGFAPCHLRSSSPRLFQGRSSSLDWPTIPWGRHVPLPLKKRKNNGTPPDLVLRRQNVTPLLLRQRPQKNFPPE